MMNGFDFMRKIEGSVPFEQVCTKVLTGAKIKRVILVLFDHVSDLPLMPLFLRGAG